MSYLGIDDVSKIDPFKCPDYGVDVAQNALAKLFRSILQTRQITYAYLEQRTGEFAKLVSEDEHQRSSTKSNIIRALKAPKMSWITFIRGLRILGLDDVKFFVEATTPDGLTTRHRHQLELGATPSNPDEFKQELQEYNNEILDFIEMHFDDLER